MPVRTYHLSDCFRDAPQSAPAMFGDSELGFRVAELREGKSRGVQLVTLHAGSISATVLPTRGLGIWQAHRDNVRFGWNSPVAGPVHPQWVNLGEPSGLGWLDGFDELMVRCGLVSNGAPEFSAEGRLLHPLHGRIANLPATQVRIEIDEEAGTVSVHGMVVESRFLFHNLALHSTTRLAVGSSEIRIVDRVENRSNKTEAFQLLYHCNFGPPLLEKGTELIVACEEPVPRDEESTKSLTEWKSYLAPDSNFSEQVFFLHLAVNPSGESLALLTNRNRDLGGYIRYRADNLPCFTLWKNTAGLRDGYVTGLEPGTNFPNPRSVEELAGRVVNVMPGESVGFECAIGMLIGGEEVERKIVELHSDL